MLWQSLRSPGRQRRRWRRGNKRILDGFINAQAAEGDAAGLAITHPAAGAAVARNAVLRSRISEREFATAAAGADEAREQRRRHASVPHEDG